MATNFYGTPINLDAASHEVAFVPSTGGLPPVCSCGWTRKQINGHWVELHQHIRLEQLRSQIDAERISYSEIVELESLAKCIESGDTQLMEWAGVQESDAW